MPRFVLEPGRQSGTPPERLEGFYVIEAAGGEESHEPLPWPLQLLQSKVTQMKLHVEGHRLLEICSSVPWGPSWGTQGSIGPSPIAWVSHPAASHTLLLKLGEEEDELLTRVLGPLSRTPGASCVLEFRVLGVSKGDMAGTRRLWDSVNGILGSAS